MPFTTITVTGKFEGEGGAAASGTLDFLLSAEIANSDVVISPAPITATLDSSGAFSVQLVANDDTGTIPEGTEYLVTEKITGSAEKEYSIVVPHAAAGGTVDISTLMPAQPGFG